jgi:hypothetical protein
VTAAAVLGTEMQEWWMCGCSCVGVCLGLGGGNQCSPCYMRSAADGYPGGWSREVYMQFFCRLARAASSTHASQQLKPFTGMTFKLHSCGCGNQQAHSFLAARNMTRCCKYLGSQVTFVRVDGIMCFAAAVS